MIKRSLLISALLASLAFTGGAAPATAQLLDDQGVPYSADYYRQSLKLVDITLQNREGLLPGQFVVHAFEHTAFTSGCAKLSNIPVTVEYVANFVRITYDDYVVDMRDQDGNGTTCNKPIVPPSADVVLDRAVLEEKGIEKIRFVYRNSPCEMDIEVTDHMARLWPSYADDPDMENLPDGINIGTLKSSGYLSAIHGPVVDSVSLGGYGASTIWFYPENTVILYVPNADSNKANPAIKSKLDALAATRGLSPLEDSIPEFKSPLNDKNAYYYVAKGDRYSQAKGDLLDYIELDTMKYGLEGDEPAKKQMAVYVRKPRATE
ncbi:MAG: hypothetical protein ACK4NR_10300 [Micavibrio sp.]